LPLLQPPWTPVEGVQLRLRAPFVRVIV